MTRTWRAGVALAIGNSIEDRLAPGPALFVRVVDAATDAGGDVKSGARVPISSEGGVNSFTGNSADSEQLTGLHPGIEWDRMRMTPQAELGENPSPTAYNAWFFRRAFRDMAAAPGASVKKLVRKAWLVVDGEELEPNNDINLLSRGVVAAGLGGETPLVDFHRVLIDPER